MLPAVHRLSRGADLRRVVRSGRRSGSATLVVHLTRGSPAVPTRFGFVVSRAVGNAVQRNRVQRRLRHLCRERLADLPAGCDVVVRVLPTAPGSSYGELGRDLDRCLQRAVDRVT